MQHCGIRCQPPSHIVSECPVALRLPGLGDYASYLNQSRRAISANVASSIFAKSLAASSISSPRLPPET